MEGLWGDSDIWIIVIISIIIIIIIIRIIFDQFDTTKIVLSSVITIIITMLHLFSFQ